MTKSERDPQLFGGEASVVFSNHQILAKVEAAKSGRTVQEALLQEFEEIRANVIAILDTFEVDEISAKDRKIFRKNVDTAYVKPVVELLTLVIKSLQAEVEYVTGVGEQAVIAPTILFHKLYALKKAKELKNTRTSSKDVPELLIERIYLLISEVEDLYDVEITSEEYRFRISNLDEILDGSKNKFHSFVLESSRQLYLVFDQGVSSDTRSGKLFATILGLILGYSEIPVGFLEIILQDYVDSPLIKEFQQLSKKYRAKLVMHKHQLFQSTEKLKISDKDLTMLVSFSKLLTLIDQSYQDDDELNSALNFLGIFDYKDLWEAVRILEKAMEHSDDFQDLDLESLVTNFLSRIENEDFNDRETELSNILQNSEILPSAELFDHAQLTTIFHGASKSITYTAEELQKSPLFAQLNIGSLSLDKQSFRIAIKLTIDQIGLVLFYNSRSGELEWDRLLPFKKSSETEQIVVTALLSEVFRYIEKTTESLRVHKKNVHKKESSFTVSKKGPRREKKADGVSELDSSSISDENELLVFSPEKKTDVSSSFKVTNYSEADSFIPKNTESSYRQVILEKIANLNPLRLKKMYKSKDNLVYYRYKLGSYRVIFEHDTSDSSDFVSLRVFMIGHRKEVYKRFKNMV